MNKILYEFIKNSLDILTEEIFGKQAFLYHGSGLNPEEFYKIINDNTFEPGKGSGSMYGKGIYTVYDLENTQTESGGYGQYIYKLKVNLHGCISFDPDITVKIYGKNLNIIQQIDHLKIPVSKNDREKISEIDRKTKHGDYSSKYALEFSRFMKGRVKGLVYTGLRDGECCVIYDPSIITIVSFKDLDDVPDWQRFDEKHLKQSLSKSRSGDYDTKKYESKDLEALARSEKTHPSYLAKLSKIGDGFVKTLIARNPSTPVDVLHELSKDQNFEKDIASNPSVTDEILLPMIKGYNLIVGRIISQRIPPIKNEDLIRGLLKEFPDDSDILLSVLKNPNTPKDIILKHTSSDKKENQIAALGNPNCPSSILEWVFFKMEEQGINYQEQYFQIRAILNNKNCPAHVVRKIVKNLDPIMIREHNLLLIIAKSEASDPYVLNFLIKNFHQDNDIVINVALNKNANEDVFLHILHYCRNVGSVFFKLISNPNMSVSFLKKLMNDPESTSNERIQIEYEIEKRNK